MKQLVYLLDDDASVRDLVGFTLDMNGIECRSFANAADFFAALETEQPPAALIDIMLPDANGIDVLCRVKAKYPNVFCILLSALGQEIDKVKGLNAGADDYIAKPFGVLELCARVNVALRKSKKGTLTRGELALDPDSMTVTLSGKVLDLNNKEYQLLSYLMENAGKVLTREALLNDVWGYDGGETRTLDNHIARLRKLGVENIETVFGVGYKLRV